MATCATSSDTSVIHHTTLKACGALMAALAGCVGVDVAAWLRNWGHTSVGCTAMAAGATTGDAAVVHFGAAETCGVAVTGFATGSRLYVTGRFA